MSQEVPQKIVIITSCTGKKRIQCERALTLTDFLGGASSIARREQELSDMLLTAEEIYIGQQHTRLMHGINQLRALSPLEGRDLSVDLWILSAGYGLVEGKKLLAPYECTFVGMKKAALRAWADTLLVPLQIRQILAQPYDLCLLLLGQSYLQACALDVTVQLGGPTIFFCGSTAAATLPPLYHLRPVILGRHEAKRFSCGLVGLKGEVAARLLTRLAQDESITEQCSHLDADILALCSETDI